jgi:diacylglycerol kinase family enzyme
MLVVLNPRAGAGRAAERWPLVRDVVRAAEPGCRVVTPESAELVDAVVRDALARGEHHFVAAGGDGTVNLLVRTLLARADGALGEVTLGAVGLGSSNDFHKPVSAERRIAGVPYRLDFAHSSPVDVCWLRYRGLDGEVRARPWVINASIGATADGNHYFSAGATRWIRLLRRISMDAALAWSALRAVVTNRPRELTLSLDGGPRFAIPLRNLGVVKNPHFTGVLHYDGSPAPDDGTFHVQALTAVSRRRLWATLAGLARGRFTGRPGTLTWPAHRLSVAAREPFAVEADGEVVVARAAEFRVAQRALRMCA